MNEREFVADSDIQGAKAEAARAAAAQAQAEQESAEGQGQVETGNEAAGYAPPESQEAQAQW